MKKWIICILPLYILFSSIVPCSVFDNCKPEEHTTQSSNKEDKKDCGDCSPFSICSSSHGFTINSNTPSAPALLFAGSTSYGGFHASFPSEYYNSYFQPPRFV